MSERREPPTASAAPPSPAHRDDHEHPHPSARVHHREREHAHPHDGPTKRDGEGHRGHLHVHGSHAHHDHHHDLREVSEGKLRAAMALTAAFMVAEVAFGFYSRSLTLVSDAGHMAADAGALLLALIAQRFAARARTAERTYGFRRAETLAAFINGVALVLMAAWVMHEAWGRWRAPAEVRGNVVTLVGVLGLAVNLGTAWVLARGKEHNLNVHAALTHVLTDALGSISAIAAGVLAWKFGWMRADPALSFFTSVLVLYGAWSILKRAGVILMEGTPAGLDLAELEATIRATPGVADFHDLHAWTISDGFDVITVHVVLDGTMHGTDVARHVGERIHALHRVAHVTVQPEAPPHIELRPPRSLVRRPQ
jgi:cobalt-zinc-cadmium efflux system protein